MERYQDYSYLKLLIISYTLSARAKTTDISWNDASFWTRTTLTCMWVCGLIEARY